jgi:uncharacterized protein (TIGR00251 family)
MLPPYVTEAEGGCLLTLQVIPGARKTQLIGAHGDALKLKVAAPPVDGAANKQIIAFLSRKVLGISKASIAITHGERGRRKRLRIRAPAADVAAAISRYLS